MVEYFTDAEIAQMNQIPDGFERIPDEHRGRYFLMAVDQIGMVTVTLAQLILQSMRPGSLSPAAAAGCVAGLQRAMHYCQGIRAIRGYVPPKPVPGDPEAQGKLL